MAAKFLCNQKPGFDMIVTIVAIVIIVQKLDWTIATILTIHGFHMIVAIASVFIFESIKPDDGYSVFTSVVTDSALFDRMSAPLKRAPLSNERPLSMKIF